MDRSGTIQEERFSYNINYSEKPLKKIFIKKEEVSKNLNENNGINSFEEVLENSLEESIIIIYSSNILSESFIKLLLERYETKKLRVYIYTKNSQKLKEGYGKFLIREGNKLADSSFILSFQNNLKINGAIINGDIKKNNVNYSLDLDSTQVKTLKRYFNKGFWSDAVREIRHKSKIEEEIEKKDISLLEFNYSKQDAKEKYESYFYEEENWNLEFEEDLSYEEVTQSKIFINKKDLSSKKIDEIKENEIYLSEKNRKINATISQSRGYFNSSLNNFNGEKDFILELNKEQIQFIEKVYNQRESESSYFYKKEIKVKDLKKEFIYSNLEPKKVIENYEIELTPYNCDSIEEFLDFNKVDYIEKNTEFNPQKPSLSVDYNLLITPFYTPLKAKESKLSKEWNATIEEFNKRFKLLLDRLKERKKELEVYEGGFFYKIFRKNKVKKIEDLIEEIKNKKGLDLLKLSKYERQEIIEFIKLQEEKTLELKEDIKEEKDKDKQGKKWKQQKDNLKKEKEKYKKERQIEEKNNTENKEKQMKNEKEFFEDVEKIFIYPNLKKMENEKEELKNSIEKLKKEKKKIVLNIEESEFSLKELLEEKNKKIKEKAKLNKEKMEYIEKEELKQEEYLKKIKELEIKTIDSKNKLENLKKKKKEKEGNLKEIEKLEVMNQNFLKKKDFVSLENKELKLEKKLEKRMKNLKQEANRNKKNHEKELKNIDRKIEKNQEELEKLGEDFNYEKKISSFNELKTTKTVKSISFPEIELNKVGKLKSLEERLYLEISKYSEIDLAKEEAKRLEAKISVVRGGN